MKRLSLLLVCLLTIFGSAVGQRTDSLHPATPAVVPSPTDTSPHTDSTLQRRNGSQADSPRLGTGAASFRADLDSQRAHPQSIYEAHHPANPKDKGYAFVLRFLLVFGIGVVLLIFTNVCRDLSYEPRNGLLRDRKCRPFSYSKTQAWWWTLVILSCYFDFFCHTLNLPAMTPSMVALLGGGLAVAVFGNFMDRDQIERNNADVPTRHQDIENSKGLFLDILSDEGGVSVHRFQAVVFNLIFGIGFLTAYVRLIRANPSQFPFIDFDAWQLGLLGVSAAGYLGFKANENSSATQGKRELETIQKHSAAPGTGNAPVTPANPAFEQLVNKKIQQGKLPLVTAPAAPAASPLATPAAEVPAERDITQFQ